jgi:hypothetical protein
VIRLRGRGVGCGIKCDIEYRMGKSSADEDAE